MGRRDKPSSKAAKTQRHGMLNSDKRASISRRRGSAAAVDDTGVAQLIRERDEALQQQAATSEVLSIIRRSPADAQPVFDAIVQSAASLCGAIFGVVYLYENDRLRIAATNNFTPEATVQLHELQQLKRPDRSHTGGRTILDRAVVHIHDVLEDPEYSRELALAGGWRAVLGVPLLRDGQSVGAITLGKREPTPFSDQQIQLLKTFADQAVIAIENVRLFEAEQARTRELSESLEQQTATSKVLKVISSSPSELTPVFDSVLANATQLCEASHGAMWIREGDGLRNVAFRGTLPETFHELWHAGSVIRADAGVPVARSVRERRLVIVEDLKEDKSYRTGEPLARGAVDLAGMRTLIAVPMLRENDCVGAITIYRREVKPFAEKQIELVQNFAAQAVIAIENMRLLNELRQRTSDLGESLEQQSATSEILSSMSGSMTDTKPVFDAIVRNLLRLFGTRFATVHLLKDGMVHLAALDGEPGFERLAANFPRPLDDSTGGRVMHLKQVLQFAPVIDNPATPPATERFAREYTFNSILAAPMMRGHEVIGAIVTARRDPIAFDDKQIALIKSFAAQAVIAIENARLLNELRESLQQQTATADVLKVISGSPGELEPVFNAMLQNATRICDAKFGILQLYEGDGFRAVALHDVPPAYAEWRRESVLRPGPEHPLGCLARTKHTIHIADILAEPKGARGGLAELAGARTILNVPMLKENQLIGAISIYRQEVRPFTDKQIDLVQNFASQAVIAIENTRLLNELRQRTNDLSESLEQQTATSEVLKVISSSPGELEPVFNAILENATRICDAKFGVLWRRFDDGTARIFSSLGVPSAFGEYLQRGPHRPGPLSPLNRVAKTRLRLHIADFRADQAYLDHDPLAVAGVELGGQRTVVVVPMLKEDKLVGMIAVYRQEVRPFTDKQIELVENFAAQAVIAIENARLLNELRDRTRELAKSLEELRTTQDRLVQTQKLALLGQLTAGIAHEIKNPLNFVNNFSGISAELIDELRDTLRSASLDEKTRTEIEELASTLKGNFDKVVHHGKRADAIVKNMLQHSREGSGEHRVIDINALVEESLNLAWHGARAETQGFDIKLKQSFDPSAGRADVFPQDIRRALLNVISNGFYAATKRRAEADGGDYEPTITASTKNLGDRVEITIRDNGTGITTDVKDKMFNPFFTTKPSGEGTGLGLSISHDIIVKQHSGSIEVDTQPGEFTEIRVILPRVGFTA